MDILNFTRDLLIHYTLAASQPTSKNTKKPKITKNPKNTKAPTEATAAAAGGTPEIKGWMFS